MQRACRRRRRGGRQRTQLPHASAWTKRVLGRAGYEKLHSVQASGVRTIGPRELLPFLARAGFITGALRWFETRPRKRFESLFGTWGAPQWALCARAR